MLSGACCPPAGLSPISGKSIPCRLAWPRTVGKFGGYLPPRLAPKAKPPPRVAARGHPGDLLSTRGLQSDAPQPDLVNRFAPQSPSVAILAQVPSRLNHVGREALQALGLWPTVGDAKPRPGVTAMRTVRTWMLVLLSCGLVVLSPRESAAQPAGLNPNRDCQTIRTCRFTSGGVYRGCLSSYSCRVCRLMAARCRIDTGSRVCQQMRCTWG